MQLGLTIPFPDELLPKLWAWVNGRRGAQANDFGVGEFPYFAAWFHDQVAFSAGLCLDGAIAGCVVVVRDPGDPTLGIVHFSTDRALWGRRNTRPVIAQALQAAFEQGGFGKLAGHIFHDNRLAIRLCREIGAVVEGHLRKHTLVGGERVDMVVFGLLKEDLCLS